MSGDAQTIFPSFRYRDAPAAIAFLKAAFGFRELEIHANGDGTIAHAELSYGPSIIMLGTARDDVYGGRAGHGWLYVAVEDPDAHCRRARAAGAEIIVELHDTDYGSRDYAARDPEGNVWNFGTYQPVVDQQEATASAAER
jgi:uncharacterized glyoxalase superfamily protein PhnB